MMMIKIILISRIKVVEDVDRSVVAINFNVLVLAVKGNLQRCLISLILILMTENELNQWAVYQERIYSNGRKGCYFVIRNCMGIC